MSSGPWKLSTCIVAIVVLACSSAPLAAKPSNKWRIEVSGGAESDGEILLTVAPVGEQPVQVRVQVADGTGENKVAKTIRDALKLQLPASRFHVETDDGEDVLVKKKRGSADFDLRIDANTVKDVRLNLDRE